MLIRCLRVSGLVIIGAALAWGIAWAAGVPGEWSSTYENTPTSADLVSGGPQEFQTLKLRIRNRLEADHHYGSVSGSSTDSGRHREGSAVAFTAASCSGLTLQETDADSSNTLGATDDGRLCIDTDDGELHYFESSAWVPVYNKQTYDYNSTDTVNGTMTSATTWGNFRPDNPTLFEVTVNCPSSDHYIEVIAQIAAYNDNAVSSAQWTLQEQENSGGWNYTGVMAGLDFSFASDVQGTTLHFVHEAPTANVDYDYRLHWRSENGMQTVHAGGTEDGVDSVNSLMAKCVPEKS